MRKLELAVGAILTLLPEMVLAGPPSPAPMPTPDPEPTPMEAALCEDRLFGDVWGLRRPAETGIDFRLESTNFLHGALDGDPDFFGGNDDDDLEFGGKLELFVDLDGQKLGLWEGLFINAHAEFRYGDASRQAGTLSPVNTALISPGGDDEVFAFTNLTVTQALSESFLVTLGKFNTIDLADKRYYGGRGVEGFMNTSLVAMPIAGRTIPISTLGVVATVLQDGHAFINLGVFDAISPTTSPGWDDLSADELTFFGDITFRSHFGDLLGTHTFGASYSTIDAFSLDQSDFLRPPSQGGLVANEQNDSWQINYLWEQTLWPLANDPERGWGSFLLLALSDGDPNPFEYSIAAGLVANGVCTARPCDSFGLGLFYNGVSDNLKDTVGNPRPPIPPLELQDEVGGEMFYNLALTDWCQLSANLQVVQPAIEDNDVAVFGGLRLRVIF